MICTISARLLSTVVLLLLLTTLMPRQLDAWSIQQPPTNSYVVMISIDGLVPDYYTKADRYRLKIPNLRQLCRQGSFVESLQTIYPSITYPSHTTLVTGVRPARHGVVSNEVLTDPNVHSEKDWYWYARMIKAPTLWGEARKAGLKTAAIGWPVTVGAEIDYHLPEIWRPGEFDTNLQTIVEHSTPGLSEKIFASRPQTGIRKFTDELRTYAAETILTNYKPNLLLLHLIELDSVEHTSGPFSTEAFAKLEEIDALIGRLTNAVQTVGISSQTTFIIVSDHGFMKISKQFNPTALLIKEGLMTLSQNGQIKDWQAMIYGHGGSVAVIARQTGNQALEQRIVDIFETIARKPNSPIYRVVKRDELARLGANPMAVCFLDAAPDYQMSDQITTVLTEQSKDKGVHGYLPSRPEMFASLIACGRGIKSGRRESFTQNINVAPTVAALLGFILPDAEGRPIRELLTIPVPNPARKQPVLGKQK
ncbi:MAG: ectonucleotide pyrophosphatase/phosphodiesterase [Acidobacteriota bacterium]